MSADDLDILDPQPAVVQFRGERLEIRPLTVGQLPRFARLAKPIIAGLLDSALDDTAESGLIDVLLDVVGDHGEAAIEATALVTGRPVEWLEAGNPAEFLALVSAVFQVNRDFFTHQVVPVLATLRPSAAGAGPMPSSSSSPTGTP